MNELKKADEIVTGLKFFADKCDRTNIGCHAPNLLKGAADLIESLTAQLTESERREKAAVEDLKSLAKQNVADFENGTYTSPCQYCKDFDTCDYIPIDGGCCFEWRGPQEAGKGEADGN